MLPKCCQKLFGKSHVVCSQVFPMTRIICIPLRQVRGISQEEVNRMHLGKIEQ